MSDSGNGARIKVWAGADVGAGIVRNITFQNWEVDNVDLPIIIDQVRLPSLKLDVYPDKGLQCYFTDADECEANPSNTYIEDVFFLK